MERRKFIKVSSLGSVGLMASANALLSSCSKYVIDDLYRIGNTVVAGSYKLPLPNLSVANGAEGVQLLAQKTTQEIFKGRKSEVFGYNEGILGPLIKAQRGETVSMTLVNAINDETNIHWHGFILPQEMDGHPADTHMPGSQYEYTYPIKQRASAYWYHPHPHGKSAFQVFMGLGGMFIVNDEEEASLNLPAGDYELPLVIQDKRVYPDNSMEYAPTLDDVASGYLGNHVLVNGVDRPFKKVKKNIYRLRVLNASTARIYNLSLSNGAALHIIGNDGGLLAMREPVQSALIAPGERLDILLDFKDSNIGDEVFLRSERFEGVDVQGLESFEIMRFDIDEEDDLLKDLPDQLASIMAIPESEVSGTKTFELPEAGSDPNNPHAEHLAGHPINGRTFAPGEVNDFVKVNSTEAWTFDNEHGAGAHPMHVHETQFQIVERIGGRNRIEPWEKGWKDVALVMPGEKVKIIMRFGEHKGLFLVHCHNLEHEDDGMMLNFKIED